MSDFYTGFDILEQHSVKPADNGVAELKQELKQSAAPPKPPKLTAAPIEFSDKEKALIEKFEGVQSTPAPKPPRATRGRKPKVAFQETTEKPESKVDLNPNEAIEEHQKLVLAIHRYLSHPRFKEFLQQNGFKATNLEKKSKAQLNELLGRIRYTVQQKSAMGTNDLLMKSFFKGTENMIVNSSKNKIKVTGATELLWSDEVFLDDLATFQLEYLTFLNMDYRVRMATTIAKAGYLTHMGNTVIERRQMQQTQQMAPVAPAVTPMEPQAPPPTPVEAPKPAKAKPKTKAKREKPTVEPRENNVELSLNPSQSATMNLPQFQ